MFYIIYIINIFVVYWLVYTLKNLWSIVGVIISLKT